MISETRNYYWHRSVDIKKDANTKLVLKVQLTLILLVCKNEKYKEFKTHPFIGINKLNKTLTCNIEEYTARLDMDEYASQKKSNICNRYGLLTVY